MGQVLFQVFQRGQMVARTPQMVTKTSVAWQWCNGRANKDAETEQSPRDGLYLEWMQHGGRGQTRKSGHACSSVVASGAGSRAHGKMSSWTIEKKKFERNQHPCCKDSSWPECGARFPRGELGEARTFVFFFGQQFSQVLFCFGGARHVR